MLNYENTIRLFEARTAEGHPEKAVAEIKEAFAAKAVRPHDVNLGRLFEACFGAHNYRACKDGKKMFHDVLLEFQGAVTTAAFSNISGQFTYSTVLEGYEMEEDPFVTLIPEVPASTLDGEKIPGVTEIGDEIAVRYETDPYALAGVGEDWVFTPAIIDRGMIVPVTWEAVFNDKTGQLMERARNLGKWYKVNRAKRAIDMVIDENTTRHRYNWRGTTIATYGDNSGSHSWDNLVASNGLVDWTDIDQAKQVGYAMTDPYTGEFIPFRPVHLVATLGLEQTVGRILTASEIWFHTGGYATSGNLTQTNAPNPYKNALMPVTSALLAARLATDTDWFLGDISKLGKCMMAEKMNVQQAPSGNTAEFERRILLQYRVNERCEYTTTQPRAMVKNTA